jgi:hypothetical protein
MWVGRTSGWTGGVTRCHGQMQLADRCANKCYMSRRTEGVLRKHHDHFQWLWGEQQEGDQACGLQFLLALLMMSMHWP